MNPLFFCVSLSMIGASPITDANEALSRGDYETAIREYRRILEGEPKSYEGRFGLARALYYTGEHGEAVKVCSSILQDTPSDADTHLLRGRALAAQGSYEDAEKDLLFVTENYPKYGDAWSALG
ncbi:MAG TPA: tetratricopeptide repeat protein, partial [bacterium]|nr:tetratricopeptide repeat protein [bacterium]